MIHPRVTVVFLPPGGGAADAVTAANQQVFLDVTAGTMTAARTDAHGLLVSGPGHGTAVPMDDGRTYSVVVMPTAPVTPPAASAGATLTVAHGRLTVTPQIAIRVTNTASLAVSALACNLTIGTAVTRVSTSRNGWIISNDQTPGVLKLSSNTRLLRLSSGSVPAVTLSRVPAGGAATPPPAAPAGGARGGAAAPAPALAPLTRGDTARFALKVPPGTTDFHVTAWRYDFDHTNPDGHTQRGAITRPATEDAGTFNDFWEGVMCVSGTVAARFVTGVTLRASGATAVSVTVLAMDPQEKTFVVTGKRRRWGSTVLPKPEASFTAPVNHFEDTGRHEWSFSAPSVATISITSGPNRGCVFAGSTTGGGFTSEPFINTNILNLSSPFQSEQGSMRITAPPALRGRILPANMFTLSGGTVNFTNPPALATLLGISVGQLNTLHMLPTILPADLRAGVRAHEHLGPVSHKENCLRAWRALAPQDFIEAFVRTPGIRLNFDSLFSDRVNKVFSVAKTHRVVDEAATKSAGDVKFVSGASLPNVNLDSSGNVQAVWNPATRSQLTN